MSTTARTPAKSTPILAQYPSDAFILGGGVAIFHIATSRVVICSAQHRSGETFYFLPKGRRDAGEESGVGAEREGYEESGYRNRLLPLPTVHRQPQAHPRLHAEEVMAVEPVWMQLMPLRTYQYLIYWYIAETLPPSLEPLLLSSPTQAYKPPPPYPQNLSLKDRIKQEPEGYEPVKHENTGVDEDEKLYRSFLVSVEEAVERLGQGSVMADVVVKGWEGIRGRKEMEDKATSESPGAI